MSKNESLREHLNELKRKHRLLDNKVIELSTYHYAIDEVRRMKTQKLWLKDEIHRIETELSKSEIDLNGHN
jgi:hypothetical protein